MKRIASTSLCACCLLASSLAHGQACPPTPRDFRPRVRADSTATLATDGRVRLHVWFWRVFCSTSRAPSPRVRPHDVIVTATDEHGAVSPIALRVRGENLEAVLPAAGIFTLQVAARGDPALEPASLHVRAPDRSTLVAVALRLRSPARDGRATTSGGLSLRDADGYTTPTLAVPSSHDAAIVHALLPPGSYECVWRLEDGRVRTTDLRVVAPGELDVAFHGASVEVQGDWRPADGAMYRLTQVRGGRIVSHLPFDPAGLWRDDDVQPGPMTLVLESTPRIDPWDADSPALVWSERYREDVSVPADASLRLAWSIPRVLGEHRSTQGPATLLPGVSGTAPAPTTESPRSPSSFGAFAVHDGVSVLVDAAAWEYRNSRWWRLAWAPSLAAGNRVAELAPARIAVIDGAGSWALADDGGAITFRTAGGLAQESLALYTPDHAYPCRIHAVAAMSAQDIVAVGSCRPNSPTWDASAREEGFVVTRDATHWSSPRWFDGVLFDIARVGDRLVAVGAAGRVVVREAGVWRTAVAADAMGLRRVSSGAHTVAALDDHGVIWTWPADRIDRASAQQLPPLVIRTIPRTIGQTCVTADDRIVVWSAAWRHPNEGGHGPFSGPAAIATWNPRTNAWDEARGPSDVEPLALACDGASVYSLVRTEARVVPIRWPVP